MQTTNAFDTLVGLLSENLAAQGMLSDEKAAGQPGQREWGVFVDEMERDTFDHEDPQRFLDYIKETTGLEATLLCYLADFESSEKGGNHTYLVGDINNDPGRCWALKVDAFVPYDNDFEPTARFQGVEDLQSIQDLRAKMEQDELVCAAAAINTAVGSFMGGDNSKLGRLFDAVRAAPGGGWMDGLEAYFSRRALEGGTAEQPPGKTGPRM